MAKEETQTSPDIQVRLTWLDASNLPSVLANHIGVQFRGDYFLVTFGQSEEPIITAGDEKAMDELRERGYVGIRPVSRVAIGRSDLLRFQRIIDDLIERLGIEGEGAGE